MFLTEGQRVSIRGLARAVRSRAVRADRAAPQRQDGRRARSREPRGTWPARPVRREVQAAGNGRYAIRRAAQVPLASRAFRRARARAVWTTPGLGSRGIRVRMLQRGLKRSACRLPARAATSAGHRRAVLAFRKVNHMQDRLRQHGGLPEGLRAARALQAEVPARRQARRGRPLAPGDGPGKGTTRSTRSTTSPPASSVDPDGPRHVQLLPQGRRAQQHRDVLLGLLQPRLRDARLRVGSDYPASHGCLRNPIPTASHIYNWIDIGDPIHVYR